MHATLATKLKYISSCIFSPSISACVIVSVIIVAATLHSLHVEISSLYEVPKENEHGLKEISKKLENKIVDLCFSQRI